MKPRPLALLASLAAALSAPWSAASEVRLPLPEAPVRVIVPDAAAFDAALTGAYRSALAGQASESDPLVAGWRQSQVGGKLETQWRKLSPELPWTWTQLRRLKPTALGLALLNVGNLEVVLVIETPLAAVPALLPEGTAKMHGSDSYHLVSRGAADDAPDPERRMGLAWARIGGRLLLATSERGLVLALDAAAAGALVGAPLPGIVSLDLDLDLLRGDRYFRREFAFGAPHEQGHVHAALRLEEGGLVEVREGSGETALSGVTFEAAGAGAAGWEPEGDGFFEALRAGLLEPLPLLDQTPVPTLLPLPAARAASDDRYLVNLEKPLTTRGAAPAEAGELAQWQELLSTQRVAGWGYRVGHDGSRRLVFAWPAARDNDLEALCRRTVERRAGGVTIATVGDAREIRVGPDLPALALRRTGDYVWIGPSARALADVPQPKPGGDLVRWGVVDLEAVRAEGGRWQKAEGPASPERVRPFSDRVLGLLGWMPKTRSFSVERRKTAQGWTERVVFGQAGP
jgi:hypothetical protein